MSGLPRPLLLAAGETAAANRGVAAAAADDDDDENDNDDDGDAAAAAGGDGGATAAAVSARCELTTTKLVASVRFARSSAFARCWAAACRRPMASRCSYTSLSCPVPDATPGPFQRAKHGGRGSRKESWTAPR